MYGKNASKFAIQKNQNQNKNWDLVTWKKYVCMGAIQASSKFE